MQNPEAAYPESGPKLYPSINPRRRGIRQKVHLPARASVNGKVPDRALEPGEVVDLSEDGACIQTSAPLKPESKLTLSLDLMETNAFVSTSGVVVWSDQRGRNGIRFQDISEDSRLQIKQWLVHYSSGTGADNQHGTPNDLGPRPVRSLPVRTETKHDSVKREFVKESPEQRRAALAASGTAPEAEPPVDYSPILSSLVAVRREVEAIGSDLDRALNLLAERALSLTHASGAAIALARYKGADEMICRARAGSDAPGLGAKLQVGSGFSGECVRTGKILRCDDAEVDPRVDREGCRMLGIRALIASPIRRRDDSVIGILEVFSALADSFGPGDEKTLERLAEMIAGALERSEREQAPPPPRVDAPAIKAGLLESVAPHGFIAEAAARSVPRVGLLESPLHLEPFLEPAASPLRRFLPVIAATVLILGLLWLLLSGSAKNRSTSPRSTSKSNSSLATPSASKATDFESLHKLALNGDPDAQFDLGARYATGEDVKQDYSESVRWFTRAAEQGHVIAQATLGAYYWAGRGIPQDLSKAYFWSAIAEAGGDQASKYRVTVLASRMPHNTVLAAEKQAQEWLKSHQPAAKTAP